MWWYTEFQGHAGYLPKNYTEEVSEEGETVNHGADISSSGSRLETPSDSLVQVVSAVDDELADSEAAEDFPDSIESEEDEVGRSMLDTEDGEVGKGRTSVGDRQWIWRQPTLVGLVCDRYISGTLPETSAAQFQALSDTSKFLISLFQTMMQEKVSTVRSIERKEIVRYIAALECCDWVCKSLPLNSLLSGFTSESGRSEKSLRLLYGKAVRQEELTNPNASRFYLFLGTLVQKIQGLEEGDFLFFPGGWETTHAKEPKAVKQRSIESKLENDQMGNKNSQCVVYILLRRKNSFSFSVTNCTSPAVYHVDGFDTETGKEKRILALNFTNIPIDRLTDSSFWFFLFKLKVYPHESHTPEFLYETLLPYLNRMPLKLTLAKQWKQKTTSEQTDRNPKGSTAVSKWLRTVRYTRDGSFGHLMKTVLKSVALMKGRTVAETKLLSLRLRKVQCEKIYAQLEEVKQYVSPSRSLVLTKR